LVQFLVLLIPGRFLVKGMMQWPADSDDLGREVRTAALRKSKPALDLSMELCK
jgi:hypothetical protein